MDLMKLSPSSFYGSWVEARFGLERTHIVIDVPTSGRSHYSVLEVA